MTTSVEEQAAEAVDKMGNGGSGAADPSSVEIIDMAPDPKETKKSDLPAVQKVSKQIEATEKGVLIGLTFEDQYRLARAYHASGLMPHALSSPEKVLVALQLCHELGLPPMTSVGKIMVLNGTPSIFGDLPLALVRKSGLLSSFEETWLRNEKGEVIGAKCVASRKGESLPVVREFTIEDAKVAKLWLKTSRDGKPTPWVLYPQRMLQLRARGWCLKDLFTDVLMGISIMEYEGDYEEGGENQAAKLVERFK